MRDLSLHILDLAQNSIVASATLIEIALAVDMAEDRLTITIRDDGCGMSAEFLAKVRSPFSTTRTTRKVGLGIPMMEERATLAGGGIDIASKPGKGTTLTAWMNVGNIDRPPLGDIAGTLLSLIVMAPDTLDFVATAEGIGERFELDTRELRRILDGVPLNDPDASRWISEALTEGFAPYKAIDNMPLSL